MSGGPRPVLEGLRAYNEACEHHAAALRRLLDSIETLLTVLGGGPGVGPDAQAAHGEHPEERASAPADFFARGQDCPVVIGGGLAAPMSLDEWERDYEGGWRWQGYFCEPCQALHPWGLDHCLSYTEGG